jgi:hypothetical protein
MVSLLNGIGALGSGLTSFAGAAIKDEADKAESARASLLNAAPPAAPVAPPPSPGSAPPVTAPASDSAAHGNALDQATIDRARAVYDGLVQRGMDPETATGFAANAVQESRAMPNTGAGDMGASHGLMQWRADRLDNYVKMFGHAPEKGNLDEQLNFIMAEVNGPEAKAWQNIQAAANDPAAKAAAVSQHFERPKDTLAEIARRGFIANQLAGHFAQTGAG